LLKGVEETNMNTVTRPDDSTHPSLADIEAGRLGEAPPGVEAHIKGCPECAAALTQLQALSQRAQAIRAESYALAADADETVLAAIDRRANEIRWQRRGRRALMHPAWAAAAAVVLVSLSLLVVSPVRQMVWQHGRMASATDMDRDGTTDIVDAYLLAMAVHGDGPSSNSWDLTGDAVVDGADVRAVAHMAVSVGRSTT
jgi:predicted anti-sigma-YlaC factor YlaD